ncbi:MAG: hypothetical protein HY226_03910, partial [Candidatus Vogelbacteria bacterium]|nr:hypothetical protein [Candidatus Vogelbacteria bacterium]
SDTITTSYDVYRTSDPNAAWNASTYIGSSVGSNYSGVVNDSGLNPSTTYYYYIFSVAGYSGPNNSAPVKISVATLPSAQIPQGSISLSADSASVSAGSSVTITATINNLPACSNPYTVWGDGTIFGTPNGCSTTGTLISSRQISQGHTYPTAGTFYVTLSVGNVVSNQIVVNVTAAAVATPDPVITNFLIAGQTTATVNSGASVGLTFSSTNAASYKILFQCPANVAIPDAGGNNMCRSGESDAIQFPLTGSLQTAIFNMTASNQQVNVTLYALRSNGSSSNSVTRAITVHPQPGF